MKIKHSFEAHPDGCFETGLPALLSTNGLVKPLNAKKIGSQNLGIHNFNFPDVKKYLLKTDNAMFLVPLQVLIILPDLFHGQCRIEYLKTELL